MLPDGTFRAAPRPGRVGVPLSTKLMIGGVLAAALATSFAVAAAAIWVLSMLLPVIVIGGAVAWGALKWRQWRSGRNAGGFPVRPRQPGGFGQ